MISCKEASEFTIQKSEGKLSLKERFQLWLHLSICGICKLFAIQSTWLDKVSSRIEISEQFSTEEKETLKRNLSDIKS